jgi:hypothetical protein
MEAQNYATHRRIVPMFIVLFAILLLTFIGSTVNLVQSIRHHEGIYSASLIFVILVALLIMCFFVRMFPLRAQDRAIRAEENLRHFVITGKLLDARLTVGQIVALRFASDEELVELARKAADERLSGDAIKRAVKNWRADLYRV